ncbi:hypothetical protein Cgig2_008242 [Carnegiea gigantea]|uniref:Carbohydrate kinase PfkB domain-containing protein n=1 Tax=Carnegiea gigantea TaxID=171969 RepID=A0A9Q1QS30_9CARY|nr:hypothetical protein Cgig2_008242 [Carnegiea gigantea]
MAAIHLLSPSPPSLHLRFCPYSLFLSPAVPASTSIHPQHKTPTQASANSQNGVPETPKRRGRPKGSSKSSTKKPNVPENPKRRGRPKGSSKRSTKKPNGAPPNPESRDGSIPKSDEDFDYDDGMDFPYLDPPLVCCFGAVQKEFLPTVRVSEAQMDPDIYSQWKMLQWTPPEFGRAPGGPPSNVAISHVRLGGRAAFMGKARIFHFNSEVLTSPNMQSALFRAIKWSKKFGGLVFFDPNLPLALWKSRDETRAVIKQAWEEANLIEVSTQELEFLLDEEHYERRRNYRPQYYAENYDQTKKRRDYYHYTREEIAPLWHDGLKFLFVTDGTLRIHYYSPSFDGVVVGTEDVLITPFTCDRTGSGDAVVAAIMRKLTAHPEMYEDQDVLQRQLRFCIAAGIISQWTIGAVRGFPTESAAQNLKEQVYIPSLW